MPAHLFSIAAVFLAALAAPLHAAPRAPGSEHGTLEARLASCDAAVVRSASDEMLRNSGTRREPIMLFNAALSERIAGQQERAAFLYLTGRLRTGRQLLFERGDRVQVLAVMQMTVGPTILPSLVLDLDMARRVVGEVIDWDRVTPDPFRDRAATGTRELQVRIAGLDSALAGFPGELEKERKDMKLVLAAQAEAERTVRAVREQRCRSGMPGAAEVEAASRRIEEQAQTLARTDPSVQARAGGAPTSASAYMVHLADNGLPRRVTVAVRRGTDKLFFAEIDVQASITPTGKVDETKVSLACVRESDPSLPHACPGEALR